MKPANASFRDPGTQVFFSEGEVYRAIRAAGLSHYRAFMQGGLYDFLAKDGLIVTHEEMPSSGEVVIKPQRVPFISYPYEWCFSALKTAALNTLAIQKLCLDHHMTLQDATAFNLQYLDGRWVFIDTGSFHTQEKPQPWGAYRQFCQHFLAPLLLMTYGDGRLLSLFERNLDGIPLDLASRLLPLKAKSRFAVLLHIVMHGKFALKDFERPAAGASESGNFSSASAYGLIDQLQSLVQSLDLKRKETAWTSYETEHTYDTEEFRDKEEFVSKALATLSCQTVWDFGANTGHFSRLAAARAGIAPVAFENDFMTAEAGYRQSLSVRHNRPLHLWMDLTNPTPGRGWADEEWNSLSARGPADMVLALAVVHHLCLGANIPLPRVAGYLRTVARHVVIEFVPKDDPQSQRLLKSRADIYDSYTQENFEAAMQAHFTLIARHAVSRTGRTLYVFKTR